MRERPILFSAPMVRAILAGTKTQTRRVVKPQPDIHAPGNIPGNGLVGRLTPDDERLGRLGQVIKCPNGQPGDRLWVRETWSTHACFDDVPPAQLTTRSIHYWADGKVETGKGRTSIHMPRWASRITLEITEVRVERLQDISEADAIAEGTSGGHGSIPGYGYAATPREHYRHLWESLYGPESWEANPWVWVVEFKKEQKA